MKLPSVTVSDGKSLLIGAAAVMVAGYVMLKYQKNGGNAAQQFLYDASNGYQGL